MAYATKRWSTLIAAAIVFGGCDDSSTTPPDGEAGEGSIRVEVFTAGPVLDSDGYLVTLDGADTAALPANGEVDFPDVAVGAHTVELSGVAAHCALDSQAAQTGSVVEDDERLFRFYLWCAGPVPENASVVYSGGSEFVSDVMALLPDGSTQPIVASVEGVDRWAFRDPEPSPDGGSLLVVRIGSGVESGMIWRLAADGSAVEAIALDSARRGLLTARRSAT